MKRFQTILFALLLTISISSTASAGDITGRSNGRLGDITGRFGDITGRSGDITGLLTWGDITGVMVTVFATIR